MSCLEATSSCRCICPDSDSSSITQYGTLNEYASAGVNICKVLEYQIQVDETISYPKVDENYVYFADTYQEVFPFDDIRKLHDRIDDRT